MEADGPAVTITFDAGAEPGRCCLPVGCSALFITTTIYRLGSVTLLLIMPVVRLITGRCSLTGSVTGLPLLFPLNYCSRSLFGLPPLFVTFILNCYIMMTHDVVSLLSATKIPSLFALILA